MIPVLWLSLHEKTPSRGYWDQAMLEAIFSRELWTPVNAYNFRHIENFAQLNEDEGAIIVIPSRYHMNDVLRLNQLISNLPWCLIILTGDEEAVFPCDQLDHPNMRIYTMTPHPGKYKNIDYFLPNGWPTGTKKYLRGFDEEAMKRPLDWFFAGQITHVRRKQCVKNLQKMLAKTDKGHLVRTPGFTKGLNHKKYFQYMASAKVIPCPSGAVIPDTFRLWEALEAGCLPIVDAKAPNLKFKEYWEFVLGEFPFPILNNWKDLEGTLAFHVDTYPKLTNKVFAWWQRYKRDIVYQIENDIYDLSKSVHVNPSNIDNQITVLIPTSPISTHPKCDMVLETISSVRERLPKAEIILMFDGIREEQMEYRDQYYEYIRRMLWKTNIHRHNILPLMFDEHMHQVAMTREALKYVKTPNILFVEHDTPICEEIPFQNIIAAINSGQANMVRLHHEAKILNVHKRLMLSKEPKDVCGVPMIPTAQWSQRPHIASTKFYKQMLSKYFSANARVMIEDGVHGPCARDCELRGKVGWNDWKVWIYAPENDMKRSYNLDGRKKDSKYDDTFVY